VRVERFTQLCGSWSKRAYRRESTAAISPRQFKRHAPICAIIARDHVELTSSATGVVGCARLCSSTQVWSARRSRNQAATRIGVSCARIAMPSICSWVGLGQRRKAAAQTFSCSTLALLHNRLGGGD